jgi:hypothetical protein
MAHCGPPRHRVVLCGNYGVGKTTLFQRFVIDGIDGGGKSTVARGCADHPDESVTPVQQRSKYALGIDTFCRQFRTPDGRPVQVGIGLSLAVDVDMCDES